MQFDPNMYMSYEDTGDAPLMARGTPMPSKPAGPSDAFIKQIMGSNSDKWTGQGFGSAQANAADMAKILSGIGITDISQFGQLKDGSYGNKLTGQAVPNTYSERQTGNAWGGTFAGKGNTGYRVNFDAQGNPQFYTTGASSSDVPSWLAPALAIGGLAFGVPGLSELLGGAAGAAGAGAAELGGLSALDAGMGVYGAGAGTGAGLAAGAEGLSALDAGMGAYGGTGNVGLSGLDAGMGAYGGTPIADMANPVALPDGVAPPSATPGEIAPQETLGSNPAQGIKPSAAPNVAIMDGGQGILPPASAGLDAMGGATGLTTAAAGGGVLGATGVDTGASLAGNLGAGLNAIDTGVASNPAMSGAPTSSSMLSNLSPSQIAALGSGALGAVGGVLSNNAINSAQAGQNAAMQKSQDTLTDIYGQNKAALAPYQQTGVNATNQINEQMPYLTHQFDANDLNSNLAPNYQFMLQQGQMANQRAANVGGGALSGNTLTGLNRYTQDYAGNAYQNAFNNYNTQRNNIYNTLKGISDIGTNANNQFVTAGNAYGTNMTNLNVGNAAANAAATVGKAQNTGTTLSNLGNAGLMAALLGQKNTIVG